MEALLASAEEHPGDILRDPSNCETRDLSSLTMVDFDSPQLPLSVGRHEEDAEIKI